MRTVTKASVSKRSVNLDGNDAIRTVARSALVLSIKNASDQALIKAVARGNQRAMALLYARHHVQVYRFVMRLAGNATLADDIVSEVFLEVWRHADGFKAQSQVSTWMLAIARNKTFSEYRRHSDEQLDDAAGAIEDPADDPEISLLNKDRGAIIQKCLSRLSAVHREVLDLAYYHEKSIEDVARIVGAPVSTVKTRMFYARQRMERLLKAAGVDGL